EVDQRAADEVVVVVDVEGEQHAADHGDGDDDRLEDRRFPGALPQRAAGDVHREREGQAEEDGAGERFAHRARHRSTSMAWNRSSTAATAPVTTMPTSQAPTSPPISGTGASRKIAAAVMMPTPTGPNSSCRWVSSPSAARSTGAVASRREAPR